MSNDYNPSIRFECDEQDKVLARAISQRHGGASMSATMRRLIREAALKHQKPPTEISFLHATRWVISFSSRMSVAAPRQLPRMYQRLLDAIASTEVDVRPGRLEPRALTREWKHYPRLRMSRSRWRQQRLQETAKCLS